MTDILALTWHRPWVAARALASGLAWGAVIGGAGALLLWSINSGNRAERKLCDQAVEALLHSKDLVEVQRAGIIIREVNCGIGRRLTENGE